MPPVMRPPASSSAQEVRDTRSSCSLPSGLGGDQLGRGAIERPHHLEVVALPLAHCAGDGSVLAVIEADRAEDGLELVPGDHFAQLLAVQLGLRHGLLDDLQPGPAMAAGPALALLLVLLHMG